MIKRLIYTYEPKESANDKPTKTRKNHHRKKERSPIHDLERVGVSRNEVVVRRAQGIPVR